MATSLLPSLRLRLALLLIVSLGIALGSALVLIWALNSTNVRVEKLASAQARIELLSALSQRVGDYALLALQAAERPEAAGGLDQARTRVQQAFDRLGAALAEEAGDADTAAGAALTGGRSRIAANMRARFNVLDQQASDLLSAGPSPASQASLAASFDLFAASFGPALSDMIEQERIAAHAAQQATARLTEELRQLTALALVGALLVSFLIYRGVARPLLRRIAAVREGAAAIAAGDFGTRLQVQGEDELSRAMEGFNRMAAQLEDRDAALLQRQQRLQEEVEQRTSELRIANAQLADIDQARRRFFTDVSHELRTPLTVILGEAELSLRSGSCDDDLAQSLLTIRNRAQGLHRRVEDLLRVARSETGQIDLEIQRLPLASVIEEAREGIERMAQRAGVTIRVKEPLPPHIDADREWLRQVLEGLLTNAVRHSPRGSEILLSGSEEADGVTLRVRDQGAGIAAEEQDKVFERFYRGNPAKEGTGFGIGLALAKWVIEQQGGSIRLESSTRPGTSGTCITLHLPDQLQKEGQDYDHPDR